MAVERVIVFARTPVAGQVKTRLAAGVGAARALAVYEALLAHTCAAVRRAGFDARVHLAGDIPERDLWSEAGFVRLPQPGADLGERMHLAFRAAFAEGVRKAVIIGTDCPGLTSATLHEAFQRLDEAEAVVGPAEDGGYVLLGLTSPVRSVFENKAWSGDTVLADTLADFKRLGMRVARLEPLRDVDTAEDLNALQTEYPWLRG
jgi:rSAM/selenodomain-associated transferase 1